MRRCAFDEALDALRRPPAAGPLDVGRLSAGALVPLPLTVDVLGGRGMVLERWPGRRPGGDRLREAARAYSLAAEVLDRIRAGVVRSEGSKIRIGERTFDIFPRQVGVLAELFAREGRPESLSERSPSPSGGRPASSWSRWAAPARRSWAGSTPS